MATLKTEPKGDDEGMSEYVVYDQDGSEEEDEGAGYFVDQAGNYYYRAHRNATPVPADPPADEENENEDEDMQYVLIVPDRNKGEKILQHVPFKSSKLFSVFPIR